MSAAIRSDRVAEQAAPGFSLPDFSADLGTTGPDFDALLATQVPPADSSDVKSTGGDDPREKTADFADPQPLWTPFLWSANSLPQPEPIPLTGALQCGGGPPPDSTDVALVQNPARWAPDNSLQPAPPDLPTPAAEGPASEKLKASPIQTEQNRAGMTVAQEETMRSRSQKQKEIALSGEQKLPVEVSSSRGARLLDVDFSPAEQPIPLTFVPEQKAKQEFLKAAAHVSGAPPVVSHSNPSLTEVVVPYAIPRTGELITEHIRIFAVSGAESLEVALTPDGQTELMLQVDRFEGEICVRVRLERGDFHSLQTHWPLLQEHMANHGIRVASLEDASAHTHFSNSQEQDRQNAQPTDSSLDDLAGENRSKAARASGGHTRSSRVDEQGWQRWA